MNRYAVPGWAPLSTQFHKHCTKKDKCQKFSRERAQERAVESSAAVQNPDTRHSSPDQQDNDVAGSSNMQNGGYFSHQPGQGADQQRLASPSGSTRQENNPQTIQSPSGHQRTDNQSATARPASNGSGSTLARPSRSLGGRHPWGEIKRGQSPNEQEAESRRGSSGIIDRLKLTGTVGRKARRGVDNQNNSNKDRSEDSVVRRLKNLSVNTSMGI